MTEEQQPENPLLRIQKQWKLLLPVAAWVVTTIGSFWIPPPPALTGDNGTLAGFAKFVLAVMLALMILPMRRWSQKEHAGMWATVAATTLVLGITAFFGYQYLQSSWTVRHAGEVYYVGSDVRPEVAQYVAENRDEPRIKLLEDAGWDPSWIWTESSIHYNRLILAAVYILCIPLFAVCIMAVAQLMHCAMRKS